MAIFRKIHTSFWSDSFVSELDNDHKLFYIYLMTNERTKQCGVYEITKKQISFDLGYSMDRVSKLLTYFISKNKIRYNEKTNEIALGNWLKYNSSTSPLVQKCINKEFTLVKDTLLIEYVKSMDTQSQEEEEEEQEQEKEKKVNTLLKISFDKSLIFDKNEFKNSFPDWSKEKLKHYYEAAERYSGEGNKYVNWAKAIQGWASKDELQGKLKFNNHTEETETERKIREFKERGF
jgi:hypothetical protein